jgi:hypothetical protein
MKDGFQLLISNSEAKTSVGFPSVQRWVFFAARLEEHPAQKTLFLRHRRALFRKSMDEATTWRMCGPRRPVEV